MVRLRSLLCAAACLGLLAANAQGRDDDWAIEPLGDIIVQGTDDAIVFRYNVPALREGKECSVLLFEEDCITDGGSSVYIDMVDTTSVERELTSYFRIDMETIKSSGYHTDLDPYRGRISFCTRVDCTWNGESVNFYETNLMADFDWTIGFAINAVLESPYAKDKVLDTYEVSLFPTDGDLDDTSLNAVELAAEIFLEAELNAFLQDLNNTVNLTGTVLGQETITKQEEIGRRLLRARDVSRSLIIYSNVTGSAVAIGWQALFSNDAAPHIDLINAALANAWIENADMFLANLTAILSTCGSELVNISSVEMEYAQSFYETGQLTNTSIVNNTIAPALANLTYDELNFIEAVVSACGDLTGIENVTEMLAPVKQDGKSGEAVGSLSLGQPIDAFFCDTSNNQVPDPVLSQGDTIQVCVRLSQNSSYFHLEDIYMIAMTQPTTGAMTHYAVNNRNASALSTKNCELGLCNILSQVPSRFFDRDSGPVRIVGVALLNLGPNDRRRVLAPIESSGPHRQLQTTSDAAPKSAFELVAEIIGSLEHDDSAPTNKNSNTTSSDLSNACIILLLTPITILTLVVCFVLLRRRIGVSKSRPPSSEPPLPLQPTPSRNEKRELERDLSSDERMTYV